MLRRPYFLALLLLLSPMADFARETSAVESPAFATVPELSAGFDLLYEQRFAEAREVFAGWESRNPEEPFGEVAVAAHYGDYADLAAAYTALEQWCTANGRHQAGTRWEVYGDWDDDPAKRRTDVYFLLQPLAGA